ncbi:tyrosine--tRNA ligase [Puccinia sorghi]|uniref:Tyrosine--tRNA ligase n=1 Tax=Puccinia sorghi TaxID=27349 RepID=A0A0L6VND2_9BASI|nr:tyrosine--tRNA ligase [Puccinia sorghi]
MGSLLPFVALAVCLPRGLTRNCLPLQTAMSFKSLRSEGSLPSSPGQQAISRSVTWPIILNLNSVLTLSRAIRQHLLNHQRTVYVGFDPTARSLHLGNLVVLITLLHFTLKGHHAIILLGGATGSVGDPSGRNSERVALSENLLKSNLQSIHNQLDNLLSISFKHASNTLLTVKNTLDSQPITPSIPIIKNNLEWTENLTLLEFLESVGRIARASTMLARDSVKQRLESGSGISFTEFTYQLLQAYDFAQLRSKYQCTVQLGGSDQYGNIMSGIELMTKLQNSSSSHDLGIGEKSVSSIQESDSENLNVGFGLTVPLLTTREGEKFGKSAGNAVWLDPHLTSPTFISIPDSEVFKYLKMLTFVPLEELEQRFENWKYLDKPDSKRELQKLLAKEVTLLVHGEKGLRQAIQGTEFLFPIERLDHHHHWTREKLDETFENSPNWIRLKASQVIGRPIGDLCVASGLCLSKGEARRTIKAGGIRLSHCAVTDFDQPVSHDHLFDSTYLLLMRGKTAVYKMIKLID